MPGRKNQKIDWQKNTMSCNIFSILKANALISIPKYHFEKISQKRQPLKDLGGGMQEYNKLDKIDAILDQIR